MAEQGGKGGPCQRLTLLWPEEQSPASSLWRLPTGTALTGALIAGVEQFHERGRGALGINGIGSLLVLGQLTQHPGSHTLDVLHRGIQELGQRTQKEER